MKTAVIFSGAGLSADSGVPTFRATDGLWENHNVQDIAEHEAWYEKGNYDLICRFYAERFEQYKDCKPHAGHKALAELENHYDVFHFTQNIDGLLEKAGCSNVTHIHGRIESKKCEWHTDITTLDGDTNFTCDYKVDSDVPVTTEEKCPKCEGRLRPDVCWFNERVDFISNKKLKSILHHVKYGDGLFICAGTSIQVYPAGYLVPLFSQVNNKYIVDLKPQKVANYELVAGKACETLPKLVEDILGDKLVCETDGFSL